MDLEAVMGRDDPMGRLVRAIAEMETRPDALYEFAGLFDDLTRKLPAELREENQLRALRDPESRRRTVADVRELLLSRLVEIPGAQ